MDNQKPLAFSAGAGSYFVMIIVVAIASYIPILGTAFALNFFGDWLAKNSKVNGKDISYDAGYGESLKFIFINALLIIITLGIYLFWFVPKCYRYIADHISYGAAVSASAPAPAAPAAPTPPAAPVV